MDAFTGKVVRKDLAFLVKGGLPVPTYVLEYLLGQYCASDDEEMISEGLEKVKQVIKNNYVHRAESESVKGIIKENGRHTIIDKVNVTLNEREDEYHASFANLGLSSVPIPGEYIKSNPKLLSGNGVWCIVNLGYIPGSDIKVRWEILSLKPIQISNIDVEEYIEQRKLFTTDEWIDFMMHTVGLNPDAMNRREKFITLARLLPHVENNFNFVELGPKGTGKSHVFQELSPFGVLVSGGDVTSPRLFVRMSGKHEELGLVGYWDVVAWDEFEQQKGRSVDAVLIDTMQNYLANKSFNRGKGTHEASASMCFVGNTKHTVPYMLRNSHLFESIPTSFIKGAFLDRIHLYNPGWEIRILKKDSFSKGYGLITDYIAAVLHALRNDDRTNVLKNYAKFDGSLSERDHLAIRKTFSGMMKLIYPDGVMTDEEAYELIDFATESRRRVKDELYKIDETFKAEPAVFEYLNLHTGVKKTVDTLEHIENSICTESGLVSKKEPSTNDYADTVDKKAAPVAKVIEIRENQKGISYESLFADYIRSAHKIRIVDPFLRLPYQISNLVDFVQMVISSSEHPDGLSIEVSTSVPSEERAEKLVIFEDIKNELQSNGVEFTYDFEAEHDMSIVTDDGWHISLGRGLDIFEPFQRFSLGASSQENRRCKPFTVSYVRSDVETFIPEERYSSAEGTLYLTIKQEYFDQIMDGTKKIEYRDVTPNTYKKYVKCFQSGEVMLNEDVLENKDFDKGWSLNLYNNGVCPLIYKEIVRLKLLAGRQCPEADRAVVEITEITFSPKDIEDDICTWVIEFHLGEARRVEQF